MDEIWGQSHLSPLLEHLELEVLEPLCPVFSRRFLNEKSRTLTVAQKKIKSLTVSKKFCTFADTPVVKSAESTRSGLEFQYKLCFFYILYH